MSGYASRNYWERTGKMGGGDKSERGVKEEFKRKEKHSLLLWIIECEEVVSGTHATTVATLREKSDRANLRKNPEVKRTQKIRQKP